MPVPATPQAPSRVCVIGAGRISEEHLAFLQRTDLAELAGVCDLDGVLASRAAATYAPAARAGTEHRAVLAAVRPDVVHVLTPAGSHRALAQDAVEAGASLVIVEKPAARDAAEVEAMIAAVRAAGAQVTEDHNYRFNAPLVELQRLVADGTLGTLREVEIRMAMPLGTTRYSDPLEAERAGRLPGGVLREFLPHLAYLGLLFAPGARVAQAHWDKRDPATPIAPDDLVARLEAPGGGPRVHLIFNSGVAPASTTLVLRGDRAWADADLQIPYVRTSRPRDVGSALSPLVDQAVIGAGLVRAAARGFGAKLQGSPIYEGIPRFLEATYRAHRAGEPLPVSHEQVLHAARLIDDLTAELAP